jgi:hypothetical protein
MLGCFEKLNLELEVWKLGLPLGLIATRQMKKAIQFFSFSYIFWNDILMTNKNKM